MGIKTLAEFLRDRIAEDEEREFLCNDCHAPVEDARRLAECEAKRNILSNHPGGNACWHDGHGDPCWDLRALASVYADHPDYQPEWRV